MNEDIMRQAGLGHMVDLVKRGQCPTCQRKISAKDENGDSKYPSGTPFRDELSAKEFKISGMCQKCQDEAFAPYICKECGKDDDKCEC